MASLCPVVMVLKWYQYLIDWPRKQLLKFCWKKWVFPKNDGDGNTCWNSPFQGITAWSVRILWMEIWPRTSPYVFRKSQKTEFRENGKRQKCVFGHFLTSDVIHIFFVCRILKSTYRTNETFFSRTHSFGYSFQVWVGGCLIKVLKMVKTMLRMKTLVWYTDVIVKSHYSAGFAIWLIGLMKLFAVGRLDFRFHDQHWVGGWLIKVLKMVMTMLRMKRMVWYTDGPVVGRFRAQRLESDARPASRIMN